MRWRKTPVLKGMRRQGKRIYTMDNEGKRTEDKGTQGKTREEDLWHGGMI